MPIRAYAPGGRIQAEELERLIVDEACYNKLEAGELSLRHAQRIVKGEHWREGWLPPRLPDEQKNCELCGAEFSRRQPNGRLRNPNVWQRMVVCSQHCKLKRQWANGAFDNRGKK